MVGVRGSALARAGFGARTSALGYGRVTVERCDRRGYPSCPRKAVRPLRALFLMEGQDVKFPGTQQCEHHGEFENAITHILL